MVPQDEAQSYSDTTAVRIGPRDKCRAGRLQAHAMNIRYYRKTLDMRRKPNGGVLKAESVGDLSQYLAHVRRD